VSLCDWASVGGPVFEDVRQIGHVVEHDRVGHEVHALDRLALFDGITALDDAAPEADPVQKGVVRIAVPQFLVIIYMITQFL